MPQSNLVTRLQTLEAAVVADVMSAMGFTNHVVSPDLTPIATSHTPTIAGPAICALGQENAGDLAQATFKLDESVYPGGVVIIATQNCRKGAVIGDNMATSMKNQGAIGFITDGGIRDADAFESQEIPIYHSYRSPINAHQYWSFTQFECPVTLPGIWDEVCIAPGDLIIADGDGITVIPDQHAEAIISAAEIHLATENNIKQCLLEGMDRETATQQNPRLRHVKPIV